MAYTVAGEWPLNIYVREILIRLCGREERVKSAYRGIDSGSNSRDVRSRVVCCCRYSDSPVCRLQGLREDRTLG